MEKSSLTKQPLVRARSFLTGKDPSQPEEPFISLHFVHSWRTTVFAGAGLACLVLVINISLLAFALASPRNQSGIATVYDGSCSTTKTTIFWVELGINICGTLLLGASNNCAQVLTAPTRQDVDKAHSQHRWLEIGIPSFRNLFFISKWRVAMWAMLVLSSFPLHLLYNSAIFVSLSATRYSATFVTEDFVNGGWWNETAFQNYTLPNSDAIPLKTMQEQVDNLTRLENDECLHNYATSMYESSWSDVLIVTNLSLNDTVLMQASHDPLGVDSDLLWPCHPMTLNTDPKQVKCNVNKLISSASTWAIDLTGECSSNTDSDYQFPICAEAGTSSDSPFEMPIKYCLGKPQEPHCTVRMSITILAVVICCNIAKMACFLITGYSNLEPLSTVGDAIASFLERPDALTVDWGAKANDKSLRQSLRQARHSQRESGEKELDSSWLHDYMRQNGKSPQEVKITHPGSEWLCQRLCQSRAVIQQTTERQLCPAWLRRGLNRLPFEPHRRWYHAAGKRDYSFCLTLCAVTWLTGFSLLGMSTFGFQISLPKLWSYGVGDVNNEFMFTMDGTTTIQNILLSNTPQLVISLLYIIYNKVFTSMCLAHEYARFASTRKPLRVSRPTGQQRSTLLLQIPFRYIMPMMVTMATLHWLISRSIFLVQIAVYNDDGQPDASFNVNACGFSPMAIVFVLLVGAVMVLALVGVSLRKLDDGMLLATPNSVAIASACHNKDGADMVLQPLMFGVIEEKEEKGKKPKAGFSAKIVEKLSVGMDYML